MARRAAGPFTVRPRGKWAQVDFDLGGRRIRHTLEDENGNRIPYASEREGAGPSRRAYEAAARYYAQAVAGRVVVQREGGRVTTSATLQEAVVLWLDAVETPTNHESVVNWRSYGRHWVSFASDDAVRVDGSPRWAGDKRAPIERFVADEAAEDYTFSRLQAAVRETVRKELVARTAFLRWMRSHHMLASLPPHYRIPRTEPGKRTGKQRSAPVEITAEEARAIVEALPEWSNTSTEARHADRRFRVRPAFEVAWETGLRPVTVARLEVGRNYHRGARVLVLTAAEDKARYGRSVPLTARARAILDAVCPGEGVIFGAHDYRGFLKAAALKVLPTAKARAFAAYDFRHGRAQHLLEETGDLPAVAYLLGHKQLTTTNAYLRPSFRRASSVVAAMDRAADSGTVPSLPAEGDEDADRISPELQEKHGRGEWIRTTDPQTPSAAPGEKASDSDGGTGDTDPPKPQEYGPERIDYGTIPSPVVDAARGLAVQRLVWDAFDALTLEEES